MNRNEAYEILIQVMESELENYLKLNRLSEPETSLNGKNGDLYTISLLVEETAKSQILKGSIRGNNPHKFEILEEEMKIQR